MSSVYDEPPKKRGKAEKPKPTAKKAKGKKDPNEGVSSLCTILLPHRFMAR
jgi:hypothetical protein